MKFGLPTPYDALSSFASHRQGFPRPLKIHSVRCNFVYDTSIAIDGSAGQLSKAKRVHLHSHHHLVISYIAGYPDVKCDAQFALELLRYLYLGNSHLTRFHCSFPTTENLKLVERPVSFAVFRTPPPHVLTVLYSTYLAHWTVLCSAVPTQTPVSPRLERRLPTLGFRVTSSFQSPFSAFSPPCFLLSTCRHCSSLLASPDIYPIPLTNPSWRCQTLLF